MVFQSLLRAVLLCIGTAVSFMKLGKRTLVGKRSLVDRLSRMRCHCANNNFFKRPCLSKITPEILENAALQCERECGHACCACSAVDHLPSDHSQEGTMGCFEQKCSSLCCPPAWSQKPNPSAKAAMQGSSTTDRSTTIVWSRARPWHVKADGRALFRRIPKR